MSATTAHRPPRWERRKEDRPAELVAAALELFVERGYAAARLDDVAARAGVSKGTLYLYFGSKEELFKGVVRHTIVPLIDAHQRNVEQSGLSSTALIERFFLDWWEQFGSTRLAGIAKLILAGASDYLLYDAAPAALLARMANAQRQISLQNSVKAERELAVSASGDWGRANRRLIHDALTDVLTQLPNRRHGMDRFAQEWSVATSNDLAIACLMLDIDHFKQVNDTRGHEVGDIVLRQVASAVEGNCRRSDIVFRYGGEEFCVICPGTSAADAKLLAERIVRAVRGAAFGPDEAQFGITLSIGMAVRSAETTSVEALIARADRALYAAKAGGRDRVEAG